MTSDVWQIDRRRSTAAEFHARPIPSPATPSVWVHEVTATAVVLGSTQRDDVVDAATCRRRGIDVVRRRSGGGAVWLAPDEVIWVDVIVPVGGPGWADDVHAPMVWLGERLADACSAAGVDGVEVHRGAMQTTAHSRLVCFDGVGPGELTLDGAKLVGMSQRRTRHAARLQCCWYVHHDHRDLVSTLLGDLDPSTLQPVATLPRGVATAVPTHLVAALG